MLIAFGRTSLRKPLDDVVQRKGGSRWWCGFISVFGMHH